jgi:hypothetical protein
MTLGISRPGDTPNTRPAIPKRPSGSLAGRRVSQGEAKRTPAPPSDNSIRKSISRFFSGLSEKFASLKASVIRLLFRDNEVPTPPHAEQQPSNATIHETGRDTSADPTGKTTDLAAKGPDDLFIPPEMNFHFDNKAKESCFDILIDDPQMQQHAYEVMERALSNNPLHQKKDRTPNFTIKSVAIENGIQIRIQQPKNIPRGGRLGELYGGAIPLDQYFDLVAAMHLKRSEMVKYLENDYLIDVLISGNITVSKDSGQIFPSNDKFKAFNEAAILCYYLAKIGKDRLASQLFVDLKYNTDWQKVSDCDKQINIVKVLESDLSRLKVDIPQVSGEKERELPAPLRPQ